MESKGVLIACVLAITLQVVLTDDSQQGDPRLKACAKKFIDQLSQIKVDKLPHCYDKEKLKEGLNHIQVFQTFYDSLPDECKKPTKGNIVNCLKLINGLVNKKSDEMKAGLINSIHSFILGGKQCFDNAKNIVTNLDQYVLNGCK